jgi:hypothetical protein
LDEEGELDGMLEQIVERYKEVWPDLLPVSDSHWRYRCLHLALYHVLTLNLTPAEEGST